MIKGCQKRIIHIKNTNSPYFEEAYFVLRDGCDPMITENDMLKEALKIAKGARDSARSGKKTLSPRGITALIWTSVALAIIGISLGAFALLC